MTAIEKALQLDPKSEPTLVELADLQSEMGKWADAEASYRELLKISPNHPLERAFLGKALQNQQRFEEAKEQFDEALRLQPDSAKAWQLIGIWYEEKGDLALAEAAFRKAMQFDPNGEMGLAELAGLLKKKLPDKDLKALEEAISKLLGSVHFRGLTSYLCLPKSWMPAERPTEWVNFFVRLTQLKAR